MPAGARQAARARPPRRAGGCAVPRCCGARPVGSPDIRNSAAAVRERARRRAPLKALGDGRRDASQRRGVRSGGDGAPTGGEKREGGRERERGRGRGRGREREAQERSPSRRASAPFLLLLLLQLPPSSPRETRAHRGRTRETLSGPGTGSENRLRLWGRAAPKTVMILPQVHLRKPCYDFYFL